MRPGRFSAVLRPGGLLVLGIPYVWGFKGIATKATPHSLHVFMARREGPNAGKPGYAPYRTFLRTALAPSRLDAICATNRLRLVYRDLYNAEPELRLPRPARALWIAAGKTTRTLALGRFDPLISECIAVYERK